MRTPRALLMIAASLAVVLVLAASGTLPADAQTSDALTELVTSTEEGPMEGVLVKAKKAGATVTITVVTNIRRVFVDSSTTPVTFWVGSNHGASIIKLEPLN